ncbi:MAG: phosphoadenylyl-sulfate reductase [Bacteroidales bacterium]|nr:phosphoadenylyl-sulfate reductase [Bacteroidales bacterium]
MNNKIINDLNNTFNDKTPLEVIKYLSDVYNGKLAFASSFGVEDQVITEMIAASGGKIKIFSLDTGRLFQETYDLIQITRAKYNLNIDLFFPDPKDVENMVNSKGINLFYESIENRKLCCHVRKVKPLKRALKGLDMWITGLRRDQSDLRQNLKTVEWDEKNGLIKVSPLFSWTEKKVWDYIKEKHVPYNKLHDKSFPSIGCLPCTRAVTAGDDVRSGRWWWENPLFTECGMHKS